MPQAGPWAVVKSEPLPQAQGADPWAVVPDAPDEGMVKNVGNDVIDLAMGGLKSLGTIATSPARLAQWLAAGSGHPLPSNVSGTIDRATERLQPTNTAQTVGKMGTDVATAMIPMGLINDAARAAGITTEAAMTRLASQSPRLARAFGGAARATTQGATQATMAGMQGGDPTTAGVIGAVVPAAGEAFAPRLQQGAENTMVEALGPAGGRGPTGRAALQQARNLAPDLLEQRFGGVSQRSALDKAKAAFTDAKDAVREAWDAVPSGPGLAGSARGNESARMIAALEKRQATMQIVKPDGSTFVQDASQGAYDALDQIKKEISQLGPNPDLRELRKLRAGWDDALNYMAADPAKGAVKQAYKRGADLVRATINGSSQEMADANAAYSQSEKLVNLLKDATNRPGASSWTSAAARTGAGATVGAALGGYEGGWQGAGEGAIAGASLTALTRAPGWRYVSANLKQMLADALEKGDQARTNQLLTTVASQLVSLNQVKQS